MKTLYVSDLDGTLLNTESRISEYSLQTLNTLIEKGICFTYATARSLHSASDVTRGLKVKHPVIIYNGAAIKDPVTGELLHQVAFSEEEKELVRGIAGSHGISPIVYAHIEGIEKVSWDTEKENDGKRRYFGLRQGDERLRPLLAPESLFSGDIFYFTFIGEKDELQPIYDQLKDDGRFNCLLHQELYRPEYWCEIMPAKASKAKAIEVLKEILGCGRVVAFGDAVNDLPMFKIADEAYAVDNAVDELKAVASGVIESNVDNGVANYILKNAK